MSGTALQVYQGTALAANTSVKIMLKICVDNKKKLTLESLVILISHVQIQYRTTLCRHPGQPLLSPVNQINHTHM